MTACTLGFHQDWTWSFLWKRRWRVTLLLMWFYQEGIQVGLILWMPRSLGLSGQDLEASIHQISEPIASLDPLREGLWGFCLWILPVWVGLDTVMQVHPLSTMPSVCSFLGLGQGGSLDMGEALIKTPEGLRCHVAGCILSWLCQQ